MYAPTVVSPDFLRDNQYDDRYKIVCPDYNPLLFQDMLDEYGSEMLSYFPSGKEVFFVIKET